MPHVTIISVLRLRRTASMAIPLALRPADGPPRQPTERKNPPPVKPGRVRRRARLNLPGCSRFRSPRTQPVVVDDHPLACLDRGG